MEQTVDITTPRRRSASVVTKVRTERVITLHAIRYLGLTAEALSYCAVHSRGDVKEISTAAQHCADHIEHIAQYAMEGLSVEFCMGRIVDALALVSLIQKRFAPFFEAPTPRVPNPAEIESLRVEAQRLLEIVQQRKLAKGH